MGKDMLVKAAFAIVFLILIILVVFGKDIMAVVTEIITEAIEE